LRHSFGISRGSKAITETVVVRLARDGIVGIGESCPSAFYGHTAKSVAAALEGLRPWLADQNPHDSQALLRDALVRLDGARAALCALDVAWHDWLGKKSGMPVWKMLGLAPGPLPPTTYTIGLDSIEKMVEKIREFPNHPVFKIKLGRKDDLEIVRALRRETESPFRVDANCAWTAGETIEKSKELKTLGVEFIEQPLPRERLEEMERVFRESALPLIADENAELPEHVSALQGRFHGINVKLVKCGGMAPAVAMLKEARSLGMKTMLGCMVETSVLATAAAHLGSLADYADLDGPLLIAEDPFQGVQYNNGAMTLPEGLGLGVAERHE
jgi:L-alanine-DL-glutamate epimerase-like enolase superfamily enzyme